MIATGIRLVVPHQSGCAMRTKPASLAKRHAVRSLVELVGRPLK